MAKEFIDQTTLDQQEEGLAVVHDEIDDHPGLGTLASGYQYGKIQDPVAGDALVGWWPLSWSNGRDLSGEGNHGTVNGATTGVAGRGGLRAFSFDGSDDYIDIPNFSTFSAFTVSFWVYANSFSSGDKEFYFQSRQNNEIQIHDPNDGTFEFYLNGNAVNDSEFSGNSWHMMTLTWDGSTLEAYRDASSLGTTSATNGSSSNGDYIGALDGSSRFFDGAMGDLRIYDRALTTNEIQALYDLYNVDVATPPGADDYAAVSYYNFNSANANDQWGSNDGTVNGATHVADGGPRGDGAYSFDGSDDSIRVSDDSTLDFGSGDAFTLSVWYNSDVNPSSTSWILDKNGNNTGYGLYINTGQIVVRIDDGSNAANVVDSTIPVGDGSWKHAVVTYDGSSDLKLYFNTTLLGTGDGSSVGSLSNSEPFGIGRRHDDSGEFDGDIDEVRIYDRALTAEEVQQLYLFGTLGVDMSEYTVLA